MIRSIRYQAKERGGLFEYDICQTANPSFQLAAFDAITLPLSAFQESHVHSYYK